MSTISKLSFYRSWEGDAHRAQVAAEELGNENRAALYGNLRNSLHEAIGALENVFDDIEQLERIRE